MSARPSWGPLGAFLGRRGRCRRSPTGAQNRPEIGPETGSKSAQNRPQSVPETGSEVGGGRVGTFWPRLGPSWVVLGPLWASLGASWSVLGPSWGSVEASWSHLGTILGRLGFSCAVLGRLGAVWEPFWGPLGALLEQSWAVVGRRRSVDLSKCRCTKKLQQKK